MSIEHIEKRRSERERKSEPVLWRRHDGEDTTVGCLLEASEDGIAMAWRGESTPRPGDLLDIECSTVRGDQRPVVVRWVQHIHEDLMVLGAEFHRTRPFPPEARASVASKVDLTPSELDLIRLTLAA